jgi:hypothetical protein
MAVDDSILTKVLNCWNRAEGTACRLGYIHMTSGLLMNPLPHSQAWRNRAEECRAAAKSFHNDANRERMLRVADDYERMASTAAKKELADAERAGEGAIDILFTRTALPPHSAATGRPRK